MIRQEVDIKKTLSLRCRIHGVILALFISWMGSLYAQNKTDVFEAFGKQVRAEVPGLQKNPAPKLPEIELPWHTTQSKAFVYASPMHTQRQLNVELSKMRHQYAPFLLDLAPAPQFARARTLLRSFEWKLLATEMGKDAQGHWYPLAGVHDVSDSTMWKKVTIPHYEGPINKATAIYRKEMTIRQNQLLSDRLFLHFNGVDYRAKVFVNGRFVGGHTGLSGAFEFDIHSFVHAGKNLLEIKVYNDAIMMGDNFFTGPNRKFGKKLAACGGPGWNDVDGWSNCPAGFGIWQDCYLEPRSYTFIKDLYVRPLLQKSMAIVTVEMPVKAQNLSLVYALYGQNFKASVHKRIIVPKKAIQVQQINDSISTWTFAISISKSNLRLWSPQTPWLYQLQVGLLKDGKVIDGVKKQFGMRSFVQSSTSVPKGRFYLNGKEVKLRGANMMGNIMNCVMKKDWKQLEDDILLAKIAGMNFWRMTQQPCQQEAYAYFDKLGLMAQTDMPAFNGYRMDAVKEAKAQFAEVVRLVRGHPSNIIISYLNEPDFSKPMMLDRKGHEGLFYGFDSVAERMNPGQVTKWVEGDYGKLAPRFSDDHDYDMWYGKGIRDAYFGNWFNTRAGWMYGCGEFGAEGLDDIPFMKQHYPARWLVTDRSGKWSPTLINRCQTPTVGAKWLALKDSTMVDWVTQSRNFQSAAIRLFTEALRRNDHLNSFSVHLLIDSWPAGWLKSLMDADRQAKPAYFAYRNALQPVLVDLRPDAFYGFSGDRSNIAVFICNDNAESITGAQLRYQILQNGRVLKTGDAAAELRASHADFKGNLKFLLPEVQKRQPVLIQVGLFDSKGKLINENEYAIDVFPASAKGNKLVRPDDYRQGLISK